MVKGCFHILFRIIGKFKISLLNMKKAVSTINKLISAVCLKKIIGTG
jgi:hypothetical protein